MLKSVLFGLCLAVICGTSSMASAQALAMQGGPSDVPGSPDGAMPGSAMNALEVPVINVLPSRLDRMRERRGVFNHVPEGQEVLRSVRPAMNSANIDCNVVEANWLGRNDDEKDVYEVSCGNGMGYIIQSSAPAEATDCITVASRADLIQRENPQAKALRCELSANRDVTGMVKNYARQAGVTCDVDQAAMAGMSVAGNAIYEIGCKGTDGYWIEKSNASWILTPCLDVTAAEDACRFTTHDEQATTFASLLTGTAASACNVSEVRYMGGNANGAYYETKCAGGQGYVARIDNDRTVGQVLSCAVASRVAGGCKLTTAAPEQAQP